MTPPIVYRITKGNLSHQTAILEDLFLHGMRGAIMSGGRNSGKSFTGIEFFAESIAQGATSLAFISPTFKLMNKFLDRYVGPEGIEPKRGPDCKIWRVFLPGTWHRQDQWYKLTTGQTIYFFTADRHEDFASVHMDAVWADEVGRFTDGAIGTAIENAYLRPHTKWFFSSTPYASHLRGRYYDMVTSPDKRPKDTVVYSIPSIENTYWWGEENITDAQDAMEDHEFRQKIMGEFALPEGLIFLVPSEQRLSKIPVGWSPERWYAGIDWGWTNPAACILAGRDVNGQIGVVGEWQAKKASTEEIATNVEIMIRTAGAQWKLRPEDVEVYADPSEPDRIDIARRAGLRIYEADNKVASGIARVQQYLRQGMWVLGDACPKLMKECDMYSYKEGTDVPVKEHDHGPDAMRYACMAMPHDAGVSVMKPVGTVRGPFDQY